MAAASSSSSDPTLLPLFLFALTAKLYIDHRQQQQKQQQQQQATATIRRDSNISTSRRHNCNCNSPAKTPTASRSELDDQEQRRLVRHLRLSIDSPDFSEHHFYESTTSHRSSREALPGLPSIHDDDDDADGELWFKDCPRWRKLMERVPIADSVLTREATMDFKAKNSNWSHFEGYESPHEESADNEDFIWSNSPRRKPSSSNIIQPRRSSTITSNDSHRCSSNNSDMPVSLRAGLDGRASSMEIIRSHNANIMPNKLIMIRHGQSEGNVDETLYSTKPDNNMRLTKLGWDSARMAGKALREELGEGESVHFIVSPYVRTVETFHGIMSAWVDPEEFSHLEDKNERLKGWYTRLMEMGLSWHEDPRIREQDFGNYQDPDTIRKCKSERHKFGSFYYRFPHGESASDVFDRVSTFLDSLWRSFETQKSQNYVLVTHGISIRVFLARYFRYSIDQFNLLANPKNCEMVILKHDTSGRLQLDSRCEMEFETVGMEEETGTTTATTKATRKTTNSSEKKNAVTTTVVGYAKHRRLKLLPEHLRAQPRSVNMFYNDVQL